MTNEEHKLIHLKLHNNLDILLADYLNCNPSKASCTISVYDLIIWSNEQCTNPTTPEER